VAPPIEERITGVAERGPPVLVAELVPRARAVAPQSVGAEQHPQGLGTVAALDQLVRLGNEGTEPVGVHSHRATVELDESRSGDRDPMHGHLDAEEAVQAREPGIDAARRQKEHLPGQVELADRLGWHGEGDEKGGDLRRRLDRDAVDRDP
jgi:hypothetical protein